MVDLIDYHFTDTGNAQRLVALFGDELRYNHARGLWLRWDGARWAWQDDIVHLSRLVLEATQDQAEILEETARNALKKHVLASESAARREAMIRLAQSEPGVPVEMRELDAAPWLFGCKNGVVDLHSGVLRPHDRARLITKTSGVEFHAGATHPLWSRFLSEVTAGDVELEAFLKRLAGYCLTGTMTEKTFVFLYGPPDGAKSTFVNALVAAWGDYAITPAFSTWLVQTSTGGNRGDLVALAGARLAVSVEARKGARFDEETLKRITGGDPVTAAAKYESEVTFTPACKIVLAANDAPRAREDDAGFWRRCKRVPFEAKFAAVDPFMSAKLRAPDVQQAILAWAVEGCLDWQAEGLGTCAAVERSTADYRQESDLYSGFFDGCRHVPGARCKTSVARRLFETWCKENGIRVFLNTKDFRTRMEALFSVRILDGYSYYRDLALEGDPSSYLTKIEGG